jgi:hypothetical protein
MTECTGCELLFEPEEAGQDLCPECRPEEEEDEDDEPIVVRVPTVESWASDIAADYYKLESPARRRRSEAARLRAPRQVRDCIDALRVALRSSWPIGPDEPIDSVERLSSGPHGKHAVNV